MAITFVKKINETVKPVPPVQAEKKAVAKPATKPAIDCKTKTGPTAFKSVADGLKQLAAGNPKRTLYTASGKIKDDGERNPVHGTMLHFSGNYVFKYVNARGIEIHACGLIKDLELCPEGLKLNLYGGGWSVYSL